VTANGCSNPTTYNVVVAVKICACNHSLSSSLTPPAICSNSSFNYIPTSSTPGASFAWTRAVVAGISNAAGSGSGNPLEILINTTVAPINVTYIYSVTATCTNPITFSVVVAVNPRPLLTSTLTPPDICSGTAFSYLPTSGTTGAAFPWTRAVRTGISNGAGSGTGNPNETLTNTTSAPISVIYAYNVTANGCSYSQDVVVAVNPKPVLSSTLTPPAVCSGIVFNYSPTSSTGGVTFSWTRAVVAGISNVAASGTGNPAETLVNTTAAPKNVTYIYTLSASGCVNATTYSVVVTVNQEPTLSSSLSPPAICSGSTFYYTPTSATSGATFSWTRAAVVGISNPATFGSADPIETLINTTTVAKTVTYVYTLSAFGCINSTPYNIVVVVNPTPLLGSSTLPPAICSGTVFSYVPTSTTAGASFAWTRA
ncbi:MAG: PKD-like domain-containing protein, partial [Bacteroidota bacterium]|nr:PKD-like domain-containing protein [Bacteroidota bacterium]